MTRKAYISYSRSPAPLDVRPFIRKLKEKNQKIDNGWEIEFDEDKVKPGDYIPGFEQQLSQGDQVIFILSSGYFKSVHCIKELLMTYKSQADKLLPNIVFAPGYTPKNLNIDEVLEYWRGEDRMELVLVLPNALAWLLGKYNQDDKFWETYFTVCNATEENVIDEIIASLDKKQTPRFKHVSVESKEREIKKGIEEIIKSSEFESIRDDFNRFLKSSKNAEEIKTVLKALVIWLKGLENEMQASTNHRLLAANIKKLTGLLVLTALDNAHLHKTIHWLNRQKDNACLEISQSVNSSFQLIVSAIANSPVLFNYYPRIENEEQQDNYVSLIGEGELVLHERGMVNRNYIDSIKNDKDWLTSYQFLVNQMSNIEDVGSDEYPDVDNVSAAMSGFLEDRPDYYLLLDREKISAASSQSFRENLNRNVPDLKQILTSEDEKDSVDNYFIKGLHSAYLNQKIHTIYGHIYRLNNEQ